jgi:hypothetical protein
MPWGLVGPCSVGLAPPCGSWASGAEFAAVVIGALNAVRASSAEAWREESTADVGLVFICRDYWMRLSLVASARWLVVAR